MYPAVTTSEKLVGMRRFSNEYFRKAWVKSASVFSRFPGSLRTMGVTGALAGRGCVAKTAGESAAAVCGAGVPSGDRAACSALPDPEPLLAFAELGWSLPHPGTVTISAATAMPGKKKTRLPIMCRHGQANRLPAHRACHQNK